MEFDFEGMIKQVASQVVTDMLKQQSCQNRSNDVQYLKVEQVCKKLQISHATLYRHMAAGLIKPSVYVGRSPRFTKDDIDNYLNNFRD